MKRITTIFFVFIISFVISCNNKKNFQNEYWDDGTYKVKVAETESKLDGVIRVVKYFDKGDSTTFWIEKFYDNGQIAEKGKVFNGVKEGAWTYWYKNGNLAVKASYKSGERIGSYKSWYPDGKELEEFQYD